MADQDNLSICMPPVLPLSASASIPPNCCNPQETLLFRDPYLDNPSDPEFDLPSIYQDTTDPPCILFIAGSSLPSHNETLMKFGCLPTEVQLMIWRYAVPEPRTISNAILVFVNSDISRPLAILPSPHSIRSYRKSRRRPGHKNSVDTYSHSSQRSSWNSVLHLLHTCRLSRLAILDTFSLDISSSSSVWNNHLWNPKTDTLFLTTTMTAFRGMLFHWLSKTRDEAFLGLRTARYVVLPLSRHFLNHLKIHPLGDRERNFDRILLRHAGGLLRNLPAVRRLGLVIDSSEVMKRGERRIIVCEPEKGGVKELGGYTAKEIEGMVGRRFEGAMEEGARIPRVRVDVWG